VKAYAVAYGRWPLTRAYTILGQNFASLAYGNCQPIIWSMAAMLRESVVVVAVMRTRPRAIPLAMITMRKSTHGFPFLSYMSMGLRLAALRSAGAPLKNTVLPID